MKEEKDTQITVVDEPKRLDYKKSRDLIEGFSNSPIIEKKLFAIAIAQIKKAERTPEGHYLVRITAKTLRELFGDTSGYLYSVLKTKVKATMFRNNFMGFEDDKKQEFHYSVVVHSADYANGEFSMVIDKNLERYFTSLENRYTVLNLNTILHFKKVASLNLYELLRSVMYNGANEKIGENKWRKTYEICELRFLTGVANIRADEVMDELSNKSPDYKKAYKKLKVKKYPRYADFARFVIEKAVKEINDITHITVEYSPVFAGLGGTAVAVQFDLSYKQLDDTSKEPTENTKTDDLSQDEKDKVIDDVSDMITELRTRDIREIAKVANYNFDKIKKAYELSKKYDVSNLVGWMKEAIKKEYTDPVPSKKRQKKTSSNKFLNFEQREDVDYDAIALERQARRFKRFEDIGTEENIIDI